MNTRRAAWMYVTGLRQPSATSEMPPLIAVTATARRETPGEPSRIRLNQAYVDAIAAAGGLPVVVAPLAGELAGALLDSFGGVLLTGGEDIDPALFDAAPHPALGRVTRSRDDWELALAREARRRRMPVLGVCRGIQVLNVALGGTLIQDIPSVAAGALPHEQPGDRARRTHGVACSPGSRLAGILGSSPGVNSMHHQSVATVAPGLTVTAQAPDGIIEGVEWTADAWWAVGVQWHPEELDGADATLFAALVEAAAGYRRKR